MTQKKSQKPSTTEPRVPDEEFAENDGRMTDEEFKAWSDGVAREMLDSLNKHAGEHEDGRWNSAPSSR